jgi:S1-C subfamily serine protease
VIHGETHPSIIIDSHVLVGTPIYYNTSLDLALLRTSVTFPQPLRLAEALYQRGVRGTILGFPYNHPLTETSGTILGLQSEHLTGESRRTYRLDAKIGPGNSGSPFIVKGGRVAGIVFAFVPGTAITYAMPSLTLRTVVRKEGDTTARVSTGSCDRQ